MEINTYFKDWNFVIDESTIKFIYDRFHSYNSFFTILNSFRFCSKSNCKVIIIGDSLANFIYSLEMFTYGDIIPKVPRYYRLEDIEKQGVLILPTKIVLDTNKNYVWKSFIAKIIKKLCETETGLIFVLIGEESTKFVPHINRYNKYFIYKDTPNVQIFNDINTQLTSLYGNSIQWYTTY